MSNNVIYRCNYCIFAPLTTTEHRLRAGNPISTLLTSINLWVWFKVLYSSMTRMECDFNSYFFPFYRGTNTEVRRKSWNSETENFKLIELALICRWHSYIGRGFSKYRRSFAHTYNTREETVILQHLPKDSSMLSWTRYLKVFQFELPKRRKKKTTLFHFHKQGITNHTTQILSKWWIKICQCLVMHL